MLVYIDNYTNQDSNKYIKEKMKRLGYFNQEIKIKKYGKKYIDDNVFFNISHSSSLLSLAIDATEVGIDCEFKYTPITPIELKNVLDVKLHHVVNFYSKKKYGTIKLWTIIESFIKCTGFGFCREPNYFEINSKNNTITNYLDNKTYYFSTFCIFDNYVTVCRAEPIKNIKVIYNNSIKLNI